MNKYKFRGKRKDNGEWVYGYLAGKDLINVWECEDNDCDSEVTTFQVILRTVGQYIGISDTEGKEIYEGDKVRVSFDVDDISDTMYLSLTEDELMQQTMVTIVNPIPDCYLQSKLSIGNIRIIGNIYEEAK